MIRNQIIKLNYLLHNNRRYLQSSAIYFKNYYVEKNDNLLDIDEILNENFKPIDKGVKKSIQQPNQSINLNFIKKNKNLKINKRTTKEYKEAYYDTDPIIRQQFIDDVQSQDNYPNQLVLEGKNLINDVIHYGYPELIRIYYDDERKLNKINQLDKLKEKGVEFFKVSNEIIQAHSEVVTPQGLIGIVRLNINKLFEINQKKNENKIPLIVILNNISDPGNMGTLIRSSLGCGIEKLLCLKKCAQLLKSKVLRSSAGAIFQLPFKENINIKDLKTHLPDNSTIYIADSNLDLSDYILDNKKIDKEFNLNEDKSKLLRDDNLNNNQIYENIKCLNYSDINYFEKPNNFVVLILNGETGITDEIRELIKIKNCIKINIPLANNLDSLNTAVAGSCIMFEIKRQFLLLNKQNS